MLEIRLLGKFDIKDGENPINIASRPAQSLFAYLVLSAGISHRREKLAGMLWPDSFEETARSNLRHALWRIRKALPTHQAAEYLLADDLTVSFNASSEFWLDADQIEKLSENSSAEERMAVLGEYQGELLPGFYEDWVMLAREHLSSVYEHHISRLLSLLQEQKRWLDILEWGERWIQLGHKPETAYRALMIAHAAKGDMSRVAGTYERCVKTLKELGIDPSDQTRDLYERLKSGKEIPQPVPIVREREKPVSKRTNLPIPLTSFIGREKELSEILHMFGQNRLVTLLGSGGVGKTRLAIQAANQLLDRFRDGIWWIDLGGLNDGLLVPREVARVMDLVDRENQPVLDLLVSQLSSKQTLLVLDNCEHLISACAQLADRLLGGCENLKILATSQEALEIFGETIWHVPSLSLPDADSSIQSLEHFESVGLFVERAKIIQPSFRLNDQNAGSVVQICRRLSGIPLAIELAAARVRLLSVEEIASWLDDRFGLLTSGSRASLPRHQTLRATLDWSHDLLTEQEMVLFRRVSVFFAGFTLAGVEAVCGFHEFKRGEVLGLLGRLVDKSLVVVEQTQPSTTRYKLLETIHEYGREKLDQAGEAADLRNRHLEYFVELAEQAEKNTLSADFVKYHRLLDEEMDEIRVAMEWAIQSRQAAMVFRLSAALYYFWYQRGLTGPDRQEQPGDALPLVEGMEKKPAMARTINAMGFLYWADVVPVNPPGQPEESFSTGNKLGDKLIIAQSLCNLGLVAVTGGRYRDAYFFFKCSLDLFQELGARYSEYAWSLTFMGDVVFHLNDLQAARSYYERGIHALRELENRNFLAYAVRRLAQLSWYCGEYEKAARLCRESLTINQELGDVRGILASLSGYAAIATGQGRLAHAAQLLGAVERLLESRNIRLVYMDRLERERNVSVLRGQLDPAALQDAWQMGTAMDLEEAVAFALHESV